MESSETMFNLRGQLQELIPISIDKIFLKRVFKVWLIQLQRQKQFRSLLEEALRSETYYLGQLDIGIDQLKKPVYSSILDKQSNVVMFEDWPIFMEISKKRIKILSQILAEIKKQESDKIMSLVNQLKYGQEFMKIYRIYYYHLAEIVSNIELFDQTKNSFGDYEGLCNLFRMLFIPLLQLSTLKGVYQKISLFMMAVKSEFAEKAYQGLLHFTNTLDQITRQTKMLGWVEEPYRSLLNIFPKQLNALKKQQAKPYYTTYKAFVNYQHCQVTIIDRFILLTKNKLAQPLYTDIPSFIELTSRSYLKIYPDQYGLFLRNTVFVCGKQFCFHFQFNDRIAMKCFGNMIGYRINIMLRYNQEYQYRSLYSEDCEEMADVRVEVNNILYQQKTLLFKIKLILPLHNYLPQFFHFPEKQVCQDLYISESKLQSLHNFLLTNAPSKSKKQLASFLNINKTNIISDIEEEKQFECLCYTEFLNYIFRVLKFRKLVPLICFKLKVNEGIFRLMQIIKSQFNLARFCNCHDCKTTSNHHLTFQKLAINQRQYQNPITQNRFINQLLQKNQTCESYCPIHLLIVQDKQREVTEKKHKKSKKQIKNSMNQSILKREDINLLNEKVSFGVFSVEPRDYLLFYYLNNRTDLGKFTLHIYDVMNGKVELKIQGLCEDSNVRHLKYLISKKLEISRQSLESYVLSFCKCDKNKKQKNNYQELYFFNNNEYIANILRLYKKSHDKCEIILRKIYKIPYDEIGETLPKNISTEIKREMEMEAAEMIYQINTNWLDYSNDWLCRYLTICYTLWSIRYHGPKTIPQTFSKQQLEPITTIHQSVWQKYLSNSQNKAELIANLRQQFESERMKLYQEETYTNQIQLFNQLLYIVHENTNWYNEIFDVLVCKPKEGQTTINYDFEDQNIFNRSFLSISYRNIWLKMKNENQIIQYQHLKIQVFSSILLLIPHQSNQIYIIYSLNPHEIQQLIKFYQEIRGKKEQIESQIMFESALQRGSKIANIKLNQCPYQSNLCEHIDPQNSKVPKGFLKVQYNQQSQSMQNSYKSRLN